MIHIINGWIMFALIMVLMVSLTGCTGKVPPTTVAVQGCAAGQLDDGTLIWECPNG